MSTFTIDTRCARMRRLFHRCPHSNNLYHFKSTRTSTYFLPWFQRRDDGVDETRKLCVAKIKWLWNVPCIYLATSKKLRTWSTNLYTSQKVGFHAKFMFIYNNTGILILPGRRQILHKSFCWPLQRDQITPYRPCPNRNMEQTTPITWTIFRAAPCCKSN